MPSLIPCNEPGCPSKIGHRPGTVCPVRARKSAGGQAGNKTGGGLPPIRKRPDNQAVFKDTTLVGVSSLDPFGELMSKAQPAEVSYHSDDTVSIKTSGHKVLVDASQAASLKPGEQVVIDDNTVMARGSKNVMFKKTNNKGEVSVVEVVPSVFSRTDFPQ